ncbi:putative TBC1 domain family member 19 [Hypsibius exemplaris]|uniref:TBC1 domain family member 19 n=1 Tax=Hypsibius exemplaris TaxID=2072580 RepID=A0A1W0XAB9_HYPEX|nr:putative TBC1 domain family member 19 [Hypsibius exemplaris]
MLHCVIPQPKRSATHPPPRPHLSDQPFYGFRNSIRQHIDAKTKVTSQKTTALGRSISKSTPTTTTSSTSNRYRPSLANPPRPKAKLILKAKPEAAVKAPINTVGCGDAAPKEPACKKPTVDRSNRRLLRPYRRSLPLLPLLTRSYPALSVRLLNQSVRREKTGRLERLLQAHLEPAANAVKWAWPNESTLQAHVDFLNIRWRLQLEKALARAAAGSSSAGTLHRQRTLEESRFMWSSWASLDDVSLFQDQLRDIEPLYTLKDLTKRIMEFPVPEEWCADSSATAKSNISYWLHCPLPLPDWDELRGTFVELSPLYDNYCADYFEEDYKEVQDARDGRLNRVLKRRDVLSAVKLCRLGCSASNRDATWSLILRDKTQEEAQYKRLLAEFVRWEVFLDWVMLQSVMDTVGNAEQFFNFVTQMQQVMQLFQRDPAVVERLEVGLLLEPLGVEGEEADQNGDEPRHPKAVSDRTSPYPPNGVIPFHEMSMYAGPLAYVCIRTKPCYFMFREFYCRYFQFLHHLSTHPQSILPMYALFENLLHSREQSVWEHLRVKLAVHPAKYVVPWLTMAFSSFIEIDQLLVLWDRIVGFGDLRVLVLLALGIFILRGKVLLKCKTSREAGAVLSDILNVEVVPLLQLALFT